jgi:peptidoglycan hydrolase CwlO-like protein|tara:strand:+ start:439 stop:696 length:258 start_codon:yes stop_codon:yes gene_type:complete
MNKYEIKYQLEQMTSAVDRLTDVAGKQVNHIEELWAEIGNKNSKINTLQEKIYERNEEIHRLQDVINSQKHKNLSEQFFPERTNN